MISFLRQFFSWLEKSSKIRAEDSINPLNSEKEKYMSITLTYEACKVLSEWVLLLKIIKKEKKNKSKLKFY